MHVSFGVAGLGSAGCSFLNYAFPLFVFTGLTQTILPVGASVLTTNALGGAMFICTIRICYATCPIGQKPAFIIQANVRGNAIVVVLARTETLFVFA
jgi:hypothetical protein